MAKNVSIDGLADAIAAELEAYRQDVTDGLKSEIRTVSKECLQDVKSNIEGKGIVLTGDYKNSWTLKTAHESTEDIRITIYSGKGEYRLAHLLEYGHAGKGGTSEGAAPAYPHIRPAEQAAEKKLVKKVKVMIRGGET